MCAYSKWSLKVGINKNENQPNLSCALPFPVRGIIIKGSCESYNLDSSSVDVCDCV